MYLFERWGECVGGGEESEEGGVLKFVHTHLYVHVHEHACTALPSKSLVLPKS